MSRRALWRLLPPVILVLAALPGAWPLLGVHGIITGAGDWPAQSYRISLVRAHGLVSWSHEWAGGLPLWSGYQPVPHLLTALAADATGASTTRAITIALALVMLALPLSMYAALRHAGLTVLPALTGALLTLALDSRRQPAANFTELWGLALTPLLCAFAYRSAGRRSALLAALAAGLSVYIHPLAAVTGLLAVLVAAAMRVSPRPVWRSAVRTGQTAAVCLAVWTGAAAFFILPAFISARPAYEVQYLTSATFERLLARLQVAGFAPGWPLWLGLAAHAAVWVAWRGPAPLQNGARYLLLLAAAVLGAVLVSLAGWGPRAFLNVQMPRLLSLLPLLAAASGALGMAALPGRWQRRLRVLPMVLVPAVMLSGGPEFATASASRPDSLGGWLQGQPPAERHVSGRIAAAPVAVAVASAAVPGRAWYTSSYSGQDWSILSGPLAAYLDGFSTAETRAAYLAAMGVTHALVTRGARPAIAHPLSREPAAWELVAELAEGDLLRVPWPASPAAIVPAATLVGLEVPDSTFTSFATAYVRDELTRRFAVLLFDPAAIPVSVRAPTPERLVIQTPAHAGGPLVLTVNWDTAWRAQTSGMPLAVRRAGPNYVAVELPASAAPAEVELYHVTPWTWPAGLAITAVTVLITAGALLTRPLRAWWWHRSAPSAALT